MNAPDHATYDLGKHGWYSPIAGLAYIQYIKHGWCSPIAGLAYIQYIKERKYFP